MANRRMFSMDIGDNDAFLEMPLSSQALYFHIGLRADDDGFLSSPNKVLRITGASMDDLKLLIAKKFLLVCNDGVLVVKHWWLHNTKRKDTYQHSVYLEDNPNLRYDSNKKSYSYDENYPRYISVTDPLPKDKISKDKINKDKLIEDKLSLVKDNECLSNKGESVLAQQYIAKLHELGVTDHDKVIVDYFNNDGDPMRVSNLITELKTNKELNINEFLESF